MRAESPHRTYLVGLVGAGIQHSSSPSMHMDEGESLGLQIVNILTGQLKGTLELQPCAGTAFHLSFPEK